LVDIILWRRQGWLTEIMRLLSGWKEAKLSKNPVINHVVKLVVKNPMLNSAMILDVKNHAKRTRLSKSPKEKERKRKGGRKKKTQRLEKSITSSYYERVSKFSRQ